MVNIYKVEFGPGKGYVWLFDELGEPLVAGPDPVKDIADWAPSYIYLGKNAIRGLGPFLEKKLVESIRPKFRGMQLAHSASVWAEIDEFGKTTVKKNRHGGNASATLPFESREEMAIACATRGWPDPAWLDETLAKAAGEIVRNLYA